MSTKQTPKSCSCGHCKAGKRCNRGHFFMRVYERSFRHAQNTALRLGRGGYSPAPVGHYFG